MVRGAYINLMIVTRDGWREGLNLMEYSMTLSPILNSYPLFVFFDGEAKIAHFTVSLITTPYFIEAIHYKKS